MESIPRRSSKTVWFSMDYFHVEFTGWYQIFMLRGGELDTATWYHTRYGRPAGIVNPYFISRETFPRAIYWGSRHRTFGEKKL